MSTAVRLHAVDDAEFVGLLCDTRHEFGNPHSTLAVLGEVPHRGHERLFLFVFLAAIRKELRLVVEHVVLRRPAVHEEEDDPLGLRSKVRATGRLPSPDVLSRAQSGYREGAKAARSQLEPAPA